MMNKHNNENTEAPGTSKRSFNWRGFFSLLLFSSFTLLLVTGVILYVTPKGRVAHWTGWTVLGLEKEEWSAIHMTSAILVLIAAGFHLYYNWGIFWGYIKRKAQATLNLKREMALAIVLCIITLFGTLYNVPPFGTILQWNEDIKNYWEARSAVAPTPHAEEFSIEQLAVAINIPLEQVIERLKEAGVIVDNPAINVGDLADKHGMTPSELFAIVHPEKRGMKRGDGRGAGHSGMRGGETTRGHGRAEGEPVVDSSQPSTAVEEKAVEADAPSVGQTGLGNVEYNADGGRGLGQGAGRGLGQGAVSGGGQGYGRMTLQQCCEAADIRVEEGVARLKKAGINASNHELIKDIAHRSDKRPTEVVQLVHGK